MVGGAEDREKDFEQATGNASELASQVGRLRMDHAEELERQEAVASKLHADIADLGSSTII